MKQFLKKKQWMMVALVAALGVAVYLNYYLLEEPSLSAGTEPEDSSVTQDRDHLGDATFVGAGVSDPDTSVGTESSGEKDGTYFDRARQNRTAAREQALSSLQEVLDNAQASAEDKSLATRQAAAIAENVLQESHIESLIAAKGFTDSVVYIDGESCSVVVEAEDLQQQESVQIMAIVVSQSSVKPEKVQIVAAKA